MAHWCKPSIHGVERLSGYAVTHDGFCSLTITADGEHASAGIDIYLPKHLAGYAKEIELAINRIKPPSVTNDDLATIDENRCEF